jgi:hypothetical protein
VVDRVATGSEIERVPLGRSPGAVLATFDGVQAERLGAASVSFGSALDPALFSGFGAAADQTTWSLGGVEVRSEPGDPAARAIGTGLDALEEMGMAIAGKDVTVATPGVAIDLATQRGGRDWRSSVHQIRSERDPRRAGFDERSADLSGPLIAEHLWAWGSAEASRIDEPSLAGAPRSARGESWNVRLDAWLADPRATPHGGESLLDFITRVGGWLDTRPVGDGGRIVAVAGPA